MVHGLSVQRKREETYELHFGIAMASLSDISDLDSG
jgi:hypothetical protein